MCYCDDYEFTINRADEYMVKKKSETYWYVISPEDVWNMIQRELNAGNIKVLSRIMDDTFISVGELPA